VHDLQKGALPRWAYNTNSEHEETNQPISPPQPDFDMNIHKDERSSKTMIESMSN